MYACAGVCLCVLFFTGRFPIIRARVRAFCTCALLDSYLCSCPVCDFGPLDADVLGSAVLKSGMEPPSLAAADDQPLDRLKVMVMIAR